MINAFELTLRDSLHHYWNDLVSKIGTQDDLIPYVFAKLPSTGDFGANWLAIGDNFRRMNTGNTSDDVTWLLQFPTARAHIPCVTFEVGTEEEVEVIGAFVEDINEVSTNYVANAIVEVAGDPGTDSPMISTPAGSRKVLHFVGGPYSKSYSIGIYSFNPDTTSYLYSALKYGLLLLRNVEEEIAEAHVTARPMQVIYPQYCAEPDYVRYIDLHVMGVLDTAIEFYPAVRATSVEKLTISSWGEGNANGTATN